jgi:hypothetical protein
MHNNGKLMLMRFKIDSSLNTQIEYLHLETSSTGSAIYA